MSAAQLEPAAVDLVASHGQTISHTPDADPPCTLQLAEPSVIAERTGITTVADFRPRDMAAGGQGAPLVSFADHLLLVHPRRMRAVQNIGGIGNVTLLPAGARPEQVLAFDTGPGNMLLDLAARELTGGRLQCDLDGHLASRGKVDELLVEEFSGHPFLARRPPKTTGREEFGDAFGRYVLLRARERGLPPEDTLATITAFTAATISRAYTSFAPGPVDEVILGGGGSYNPTLVRMLSERLAPARVLRHEDLGISSDAKEAIAFAVLGYFAVQGLANNLPSCTGARRPVPMGKIVPGANWLRLIRESGRGRR
jgi:anhydro-N-acetylmuramic acid kinase